MQFTEPYRTIEIGFYRFTRKFLFYFTSFFSSCFLVVMEKNKTPQNKIGLNNTIYMTFIKPKGEMLEWSVDIVEKDNFEKINKGREIHILQWKCFMIFFQSVVAICHCNS